MAKLVRKGGKGSGNWGHAGRPGKRGGSSKRGTAGQRRLANAHNEKNVPAAMKKKGKTRADFMDAVDNAADYVSQMDNVVRGMLGDLSTASDRDMNLYRKFMDASTDVFGKLVAIERADVSTGAFPKLIDATSNDVTGLNDIALKIADVTNNPDRIQPLRDFTEPYVGALATLRIFDLGE